MYTIARMSDEGNWEALESFETYSEADMNLDWYCDKYPSAYIDVVASHPMMYDCYVSLLYGMALRWRPR